MTDPIAQFEQWFAQAAAHKGVADATAMTLATANAAGMPSARIVLLKGHDADGFVFYGNMQSRKFGELIANPHASLCFYWPALDRQIRIEGPVSEVSEEEADAYFKTRERGSQIGAWASDQSRPLAARELFTSRIAELTKQYEGYDVPRPPHWSGWRLAPTAMEFWSQGEHRLHERERFTRTTIDAPWQHTLLYP